MKTAAEILRDAASLIETHGWTTGDYRSDDGCLCADGAIQAASGVASIDNGGFRDVHFDSPDAPEVKAYRAAYNTACRAAEAADYRIASIIGYNDAAGRTADEVTALLRSAAEVAA